MPWTATFVCVAAVIVVTMWQLHPSLIFSGTTTTGGDNGGHFALPAYLSNHLLNHGQLTGWDNSWYDGFPLYTYYFVLPDLFTALASKWHLMSYAFAFKVGTIIGSLLLPIAAWAMARLFGMRRGYAGALAAITLCYLFDYTYTIDGGNLFSTLAGEYSYSLSIAFGLVFLGLMAHGLRTGRFRGLTAAVFLLCLLAHLLPALFVLGGAAVLIGLEMLPAWLRPRDAWHVVEGDLVVPARLDRRQSLWWGVSTLSLALLLGAMWWVPFGLDQVYANPMGYQNVTTYLTILFPAADYWAIALACLGAVIGIAVRSRFAIMLTLLGFASGMLVRFDPQASLYNTRLLPLWFLCIYLLAGWCIATIVTTACDLLGDFRERRLLQEARWFATQGGSGVAGASQWAPQWAPPVPVPPTPPPGTAFASGERLWRGGAPPPVGPANGANGADGAGGANGRATTTTRWPVAAVVTPLVTLLVALVVVITPFVLPAGALSDIGITPGQNQVTNWSNFNYEGYEGQPAYPEYHAVVSTMEQVGFTHGCGQAMWEYEPSLNRFGTTMALMLLPYWSNGCIGSMEGLLFESSATTPYHFLNQAELSLQPSEPQVGLDYETTNVVEGVKHLQLLGVRYFMASTPTIEAEADADPSLKLVATTGPWSVGQQGTTSTTWKIYQVLRSPLVQPLTNLPAVEQGIGAGQTSWLKPSEAWYNDPARWNVELAQSGPANWPRVPIGDTTPPRHRVPHTTVTHVVETDDTMRFHVSRVGVPVLVKMSYFPNWQASGATGPYRVTPNLMVVVPTSHDVLLTYGTSGAEWLGDGMTLVGAVVLVVTSTLAILRRRRLRPAPSVSGGPSSAP